MYCYSNPEKQKYLHVFLRTDLLKFSSPIRFRPISTEYFMSGRKSPSLLIHITMSCYDSLFLLIQVTHGLTYFFTEIIILIYNSDFFKHEKFR